MSKRANATALNSVFTEIQNLKALHATLMLQGDREVGDAVQRAMRELQSPTVTGAAGQVSGVTFDATRP
jgi:hypothetical protein